MNWVWLCLACGIIKGLRDMFKKKALDRSSTIEVLFLYTCISLLLVTPEAGRAGGLSAETMLLIAAKSFACFLAWIAGFSAVKNLPVGVYGLLDQTGIIFSAILGFICLQETLGLWQIIGFLLVIAGLVLMQFPPGRRTRSEEPAGFRFVLLALACAFMNAVSSILEKILLSNNMVTSGPLQFWFMLFLVLYFLAYILISRSEIHWKSTLKNGWIWLTALMLVIGDRCLFLANEYPESKVTIMTLLKQSSCVISIIGGRLFFKEKDFLYKLFCAIIVLGGIALSVFL